MTQNRTQEKRAPLAFRHCNGELLPMADEVRFSDLQRNMLRATR
jgi:hypothetical protein